MRIPPDFSTTQGRGPNSPIYGEWAVVELYRHHVRHTTAADYGVVFHGIVYPRIFRLPRYSPWRLDHNTLFGEQWGDAPARDADHVFLATFFEPTDSPTPLVTTAHWVSSGGCDPRIGRVVSTLYLHGRILYREDIVGIGDESYPTERFWAEVTFPAIIWRHITSSRIRDGHGYQSLYPLTLPEEDMSTKCWFAPLLEIYQYVLVKAQHMVLANRSIDKNRLHDAVFAWRMLMAHRFSRDPACRLLPPGHRAAPPLAINLALDQIRGTSYELQPR